MVRALSSSILTHLSPRIISSCYGRAWNEFELRAIPSLPPPWPLLPLVDSRHDFFLRRYLASGEGSAINYTRVLLAQHRLGYIFPVLNCVREVPSSDANSTFVGLLRPVATAEDHMLLSSDGVITGLSQASFKILDLEPGALSAGERNICEWVPDFDKLKKELAQSRGTVITFDCSLASGAATARVMARHVSGASLKPEAGGHPRRRRAVLFAAAASGGTHYGMAEEEEGRLLSPPPCFDRPLRAR